MKMKHYILATLALLGLVACQNEELGEVNADPSAVRIQASVGEIALRSNPTGDEITSARFNPGDSIAIHTEDQATVTYTYDGNAWTPEPGKYLKWNKTEHEFYAYYPAEVFTGTEDIPTDQSDAEKIVAADYMSFEQTVIKPKDATLKMEMQRRTSRIVIDETEITWKNQFLNGNNETHEVKSIRIHCEGKNGILEITPYKVGTTYYALVNPGTGNAEVPFITVTVAPKGSTDDSADDHLTIRGIPEHKAGISYNCRLTLGKNEAELSEVEVIDWETGKLIDNGIAVDDYRVVKRPDGGDSYHIYSVEGLLEVNKILTAPDVTEEMLRADITLYGDFTLPTPADGESNWTAIGNDSYYFSGDFNGNGHTIRGLVVRSNPTAPAQGLIGFTNGNVSNLTLEGCTVIGNKWVGGIVGINYGYNIENCKVVATEDYPVWIESAGGLVGGITGRHFNGTILKSSLVCELGASITIKNTGQAENVGGIAGLNDTGAMNECSVINNGGTITITSVGNNVGGFVGQNYASEDAHSVDFCIRDCSVNGVTVTGAEYVGGFTGRNDY